MANSLKVNKGSVSRQPLSPLTYAVIALIGLVPGILLLVFFIFQVPKLAGAVQNQVFYVLLIPSGLACAAFLFGAMKSYATLTHRSPTNTVELGGPAAIFCLVVIGGFRLISQNAPPFELIVRLAGAGDKDQLITSGSVMAKWASYSTPAPIPIDNYGVAYIRGIDHSLVDKPVQILPKVEGYRESWIACKPRSNVCDLQLEESPTPRSRVRGLIVQDIYPDATLLLVQIVGPYGTSEGHPDRFGNFDLVIAGTTGDQFAIQVFSDSKRLCDYTETLGGYGDLLRLELH